MTALGTYTVAELELRLDRIARELYGTERGGTIEALLDANPGLAELGPMIPLGTVLTVPPQPVAPPAAGLTRLWE